ncbi:SPRY domain-containing protein [Hirsutella rhossiliensis]|uniref:SPRY domain-containing protein n=1 Tax=Hirsutella rhossiliensis TaxID=111463 RepID=A0A9P8MQS9_9HYPO|nr:SPRY domain-containing protein [Hirsutella rhossiliensis]KAH0959469.1 SPRY domain-containing protein [Hirsutella rhossiliensis]
MYNSFGQGSPGLSGSDSSDGSSGHSSNRLASPYTPAAPRPADSSHFYSHPARTSVLSADGQLLVDPVPGLAGIPRGDGTNMDASGNDDMLHVWSASGSLPSFSRAFDMFTQPLEADDLPSSADGQFFVPSYLRGSTYMQMLEEAHKAKLQAQKDSKRSAANGAANSTSAFPQAPLPPGAHRGLTHSVIERPPASDDDAAVASLPTRWNKDDVWTGIDLQPDDLSVKYTGPKNHHERDHEASAARADHYMPPPCGLYYFEVQILHGKRDDTTIAIGFSTKVASLSRPVGWEPESWGYHGDDGRCFSGQNIGRPYGPTFNAGDVVGCGVNFRDHTAFFTRNGVKLGVAFHDVARSKLYPSVSLKKPGEHVLVNFGQLPFVYNIDDMMREQREKIQRDIEAADTSRLEAGMSETDLIQTLVLEFLQHDGYVETARAFAEDMKTQKQALNLDPSAEVEGINIKDEEDANNRQRIRRSILEGDIDRALKYTNAYYPQVLQDHEDVFFKLRCRKFIEMVRKAAQMRAANDPRRSNGHGPASHEMDVDLNGAENVAWGESMDMDGSEQQTELMRLEQSMLEYGQVLEAQYANDSRKEVSNALGEIWALVAYSNPLKEPQVSHLLDRKGRAVVAEELNSAILSSLGKSSRACLEKVYAQTSVLLEDLRRDGGPGAFVSLQDLMKDIAASPQI